jgi:diguanylate cyclase (GGDEF)-like protein/PAS domain S-box-containing protein
MTELVHPGDADALLDVLDHAISHTGPSASAALRVRTGDSETWQMVEVVGVNVVGDPALKGLVISLRPVTAEVTATSAPDTDEMAVFDTTPNLVLVVDSNGAVVKLNRAAESVTGLTSAAATGQQLSAILRDAGGSESLDAALRQIIGLRRPLSLEGDVWSARGDRHRIRWETAVLTGRAGEVTRVIVTGVDVTAQRNAEHALRQIEAQSRHASLHDPLTGLANRTLLFDRLQQALLRSPRMGNRVALLFVDLDRFKLVNDSFGHGAGDRLLCEVADRLRNAVRGHDTVARLGGDEFVVLLEGVRDEVPAVAVADRLMNAMQPPLTINGLEHVLAASIGIAVSRLNSSADDLLAEADTAMYRAKASGKGRYELFDDHLREEVLLRMETEAALRGGIGRGELVTWFQPQVNLRTGTILGLEALIRWEHPQRGLLPPAAFLPIAEEAGLMDQIWDVVVRTSFERMMFWRHEYPHHADLRIAMNLSPRQLGSTGLVDDLAERLNRYQLPPDSVTVELAEGSLTDISRSARTIEELRALGVRVSIDDFGTGVASLGHLRMFAVDELKVDQLFVANVATSMVDHGIVAAVVELARAVGAQMVAEGVETAEIARRCRQLGVVIAQGHLFSRPLPSDELEPVLASDRPFSSMIQEIAGPRQGVALAS